MKENTKSESDLLVVNFFLLAFSMVGLLATIFGLFQIVGVYKIIGDGTIRAGFVMMAAGFVVGIVPVAISDSLETNLANLESRI